MTPEEVVAALNELPRNEGEEPIYIPKEQLERLVKLYPPPQSWYESSEEDLF